jgi:DUF4097 and DUF4098 domain-containing protein YvlB
MGRQQRIGVAAGILLTALSAGCATSTVEGGKFERTLRVDGPVRLEVEAGAGRVVIRSGSNTEVRVEGSFRVRPWAWQNADRILESFRKFPPVEQHGNFVRIGKDRERPNLVVDYSIVVPQETELSVGLGSGELDVRDVRGPAGLQAGSGNVKADAIGGDVTFRAGSGDVRLSNIRGAVRLEAGSGDLWLENVQDEIRVTTGSGAVRIQQPGSRVTARTGSGDIEVRGAKSDLYVTTGSGDLTAEGSPAPHAFWEVRARSGDVRLEVPSNASFTFFARTRSGDIETQVPMEVTERSRRELRGRVGSGEARITVETTSGTISLR